MKAKDARPGALVKDTMGQRWTVLADHPRRGHVWVHGLKRGQVVTGMRALNELSPVKP